MPKITKLFSIDISPQKYIDACDMDELQELYLLCCARLDREKYKHHKQYKKSELKGKRKILKGYEP